MKPNNTPRNIVAKFLVEAGYTLDGGDIIALSGTAWKKEYGIPEKWFAHCLDQRGKPTTISSLYSISHCTIGVEVVKNGNPTSRYSGTLVAVPKSNKPRPGEVGYRQWVEKVADELGVTRSAVDMRINRGTHPMPEIRRVNKRVLFVKE